MKQKTKKRPQIVSVVIALACLICLILVIDFVVRTVTRANVTYVVSEGTFSTDNNNGIPEATDKPTEAKDDKKGNETATTTKNDDPNFAQWFFGYGQQHLSLLWKNGFHRLFYTF